MSFPVISCTPCIMRQPGAGYRAPGPRPGPGVQPDAQAATWARELNPSLARMFATCLAAVAGLITSSSAMALLLCPAAISATISRSRGVRPPGAAAAAGDVTGGGSSRSLSAGISSASSTASSLLSAMPWAHSRDTAASPRCRTAARYRSVWAPGSGDQHDGELRPLLRPGQRGERGESARHADPAAGAQAEPQALTQVLPGQLHRAEIQRDATESGQAARRLRPGAELAQDRQRLKVLAAGVVGIAA